MIFSLMPFSLSKGTSYLRPFYFIRIFLALISMITPAFWSQVFPRMRLYDVVLTTIAEVGIVIFSNCIGKSLTLPKGTVLCLSATTMICLVGFSMYHLILSRNALLIRHLLVPVSMMHGTKWPLIWHEEYADVFAIRSGSSSSLLSFIFAACIFVILYFGWILLIPF
jgi:hypothetical protein